MIKNREDYQQFVQNECGFKPSLFLVDLLKVSIKRQVTLKFLFLLRTSEYYRNCKKGGMNQILHFMILYLKSRNGIKLGFSIPDNVFDSGLQLPHYGTIVVNANARVGKNCRIHVCTNIGASGGSNKAPIIGDNVYIAPGVKIYGDIRIANNIAFTANAAVSKSFQNENMLVGGVPAKELKEVDISKLIKLN